jgi:selenocysteine-specific elongation factor
MIVGTAGHIDHGKSALVRALTGVDTDRLKEEKARGISIDLGFAYMPAGDRSTLGFVDAPGHERFVRNMLAGATGIDFVLLVVAADDGVMPQTREHLNIVDLLGVTDGLVALTKTDLVAPELQEAAAEEIRAALAPTGLKEAEIVPVSALTGQGIETLRARLLDAAGKRRAPESGGRFRLAVDRSFSITGAGAVVTGAVVSGEVRVGDPVLVSPSGLRARVRAIHAQNAPAALGRKGDRCALNLAGDGVSHHLISRGDVVLDPELHAPADRIDACLRLLPSETRPLAHWTPVRLHHGAAEVGARVALLEPTPIDPGTEGRVQLVLERPVAAAVLDRFILRDASGSRTIAGGRFVDLRGPRRRRRAAMRLVQLEAMEIPDARSAFAALLDRPPYVVDLQAFARDRALDQSQLGAAVAKTAHRTIAADGQALAVSPDIWSRLVASARAALQAFHQARPELPGLAPARLAPSLEPRLPPRAAAAAIAALVAAGKLASDAGAVRLPEHRFSLDDRDERLWSRIEPLLSAEERFRPPRAAEMAGPLGAAEAEVRRLLKTLARERRVVEIAPDHFFRREAVEEMARIAAEVAAGRPDGQFGAAQVRDRLNNGRKVAIQVLEYFDRQGVTVRRGDLRRIDPRRLQLFLRAPEPADVG